MVRIAMMPGLQARHNEVVQVKPIVRCRREVAHQLVCAPRAAVSPARLAMVLEPQPSEELSDRHSRSGLCGAATDK